MPRKDQMTGCMVMTHGEFWASEAKREGKGREPYELETDMWSEIEKDERTAENEIMSEPEKTLNDLRNWYLLDPEFITYLPTEVLAVRNAKVSFCFRGSTSKYIATVRCTDGRIRQLEYKNWYTTGSMWEAPDGDTEIEEVCDVSMARLYQEGV